MQKFGHNKVFQAHLKRVNLKFFVISIWKESQNHSINRKELMTSDFTNDIAKHSLWTPKTFGALFVGFLLRFGKIIYNFSITFCLRVAGILLTIYYISRSDFSLFFVLWVFPIFIQGFIIRIFLSLTFENIFPVFNILFRMFDLLAP